MTSAERAARMFDERCEASAAVYAEHPELETQAADSWPEGIWDRMRSDDIAAIARELDAAVADALAARWIPVTERLPEPGSYLVTIGSSVCRAYYDGNVWTSDGWIVEVLAWQPLPAPWVKP